jgi:DNA-binding response OmpR family regulator
MTTLLYLCHISPSPLTHELQRAGYDVYECLSGSEVLHLLQQQSVKAVVVAAGIEDTDLPEIRRRSIVLQLERESSASDVLWELGVLFPVDARVH